MANFLTRLNSGKGVQADVDAYMAWSMARVLKGQRKIANMQAFLRDKISANPHLTWPKEP